MVSHALLLLCATALPPVSSLATPAARFREDTLQVSMDSPASPLDARLKVPGQSPAYYCSDPAEDIFQIISLHFYPTTPRV
jgi:hypothetical protein